MARARRVEVLVQKKVLHAAEQDRPDAQAERAAWQAEMMGLDVERLVFLDKTWTATNFTRLRGARAARPTARRQDAARALEDDDLRRRLALGRSDRADRRRRPARWLAIPRLRAAATRADVA